MVEIKVKQWNSMRILGLYRVLHVHHVKTAKITTCVHYWALTIISNE
jgi:hypothetical protein